MNDKKYSSRVEWCRTDLLIYDMVHPSTHIPNAPHILQLDKMIDFLKVEIRINDFCKQITKEIQRFCYSGHRHVHIFATIN